MENIWLDLLDNLLYLGLCATVMLIIGMVTMMKSNDTKDIYFKLSFVSIFGTISSFLIVVVLTFGTSYAVSERKNESTFIFMNQDKTVSIITHTKIDSDQRDIDNIPLKRILTTEYIIHCQSQGKKISAKACWDKLKKKSAFDLISMGQIVQKSKLAQLDQR